MKNLSYVIYTLLFVVLLCFSLTTQEENNDDGQLMMQDKQEPIKPNDVLNILFTIDESKKPCPENQKKDIFEECKPTVNYDTKSKVDDDGKVEDKEESIKPHDNAKVLRIIDVPKKPCPENLKRDIFGRCRPTANFETKPEQKQEKRETKEEQETENDDQKKQDEQEPIIPKNDSNVLNVITLPIKLYPENQEKDVLEKYRPAFNYEINQIWIMVKRCYRLTRSQ